jgi:hypothetical protein
MLLNFSGAPILRFKTSPPPDPSFSMAPRARQVWNRPFKRATMLTVVTQNSPTTTQARFPNGYPTALSSFVTRKTG